MNLPDRSWSDSSAHLWRISFCLGNDSESNAAEMHESDLTEIPIPRSLDKRPMYEFSGVISGMPAAK